MTNKPLTITELQKLTSASLDLCEGGQPQIQINKFSPSNEPDKNSVTFMVGKAVNANIANEFAAILVNKEGAKKLRDANVSTPLLIVDNPQLSSFSVSEYFYDKPDLEKFLPLDPNYKDKNFTVFSGAIIADGTQIKEGTVIHPGVVIYPNVQIGKQCIIYSNVVIREGTVIGDHCIIHANTVIGADGFGYVPDPKLGLLAVPQVGNVIIGNHVHIGASTTIDRGAIGSTVIGEGTKIDNQVQIGHNVKIGKYCILCGQSGVAGSSTIGDNVVLAGKAGVGDHVTIASGVRLGANSCALSNITEKGDYEGTPASPSSDYRRNSVEFRKLFKTLSDLRKKLA